MKSNNPEVYFHLGLPKTASTYLQALVFPRLQGIAYFRKKYFNQFAEIIEQGEKDRYLFSCEFDKELGLKLELIAQNYPQAHILLVFRRQDQWISSKYKYYLRKHGHKSFTEFVDVAGTAGEWGRVDLLYRPKIEKVLELFEHPPLVLNFADLKQDQAAFTQRLTDYLGCTLPPFRNRVVKKAFNLRQLLVVRQLNRRYRYHKLQSPSRFRNRLHYRYREYLLHTVAFFAQFWPASPDPEQLIPSQALTHIREAFADDWAYVEAFSSGMKSEE